MLIADMGSVRPGLPTLTVALRGTAMPTVEVETLVGPKHSGQYGGAAPDALIVLLHALASLHDEHGDVAVEGLRREEWTGASYSEGEFRELAEVLPGLPLIGSGGLGSRVGRVPRSRSPGSTSRRSTTRSTRSRPGRAPASTSASIPSRTPPRRRRRSSATSARCVPSGSSSRCAPEPSATASPPTRPVRRTGQRRRRWSRSGAPPPRSPRPAARSPSSTRWPVRCPRPRSSCSGRRTATPTSTPRTSACSWTSSRRRSPSRPSSSAGSRRRWDRIEQEEA